MKGYYPSTGFRDSIIMTDGSAGICKYIGTALSSVSSQPCIPSLAICELLPPTAHPQTLSPWLAVRRTDLPPDPACASIAPPFHLQVTSAVFRPPWAD